MPISKRQTIEALAKAATSDEVELLLLEHDIVLFSRNKLAVIDADLRETISTISETTKI